MKKFPVMAAAVVLLLVTGCTTGSEAPETSPPPSNSITPEPDPSPTVLSLEQAGEEYLRIVCPANALYAANDDAFNAEPRDLSAIQSTAAAARDGAQEAALAIDDVSWPAEIAEDITAVQNEYFGAAGEYDQVANSGTVEAALIVPFANTAGEAPQRIRARTGLPADTAASCL